MGHTVPDANRVQIRCPNSGGSGFAFTHADGVERQPLLFLRADGKAHVILAEGDSFTKKSPGDGLPLLWQESRNCAATVWWS